MNTGDLLKTARSEARQYIQTEISTDSIADHCKLSTLFVGQRFMANNFADVPLDILRFDWQQEGFDRNWWWQLQALPFLNWFCNSFKLQTHNERKKNYLLCRDGVLNWIKQAANNPELPLVWHDHASAFRVRNLSNWLLFCHLNGLEIDADPQAQALAGLIERHLVWLADDLNYSRHSNHGFDQAMIGLVVALMFTDDQITSHQKLNGQRLKDELLFAFTPEGVHKENSPSYQKMMLARLRQLSVLTDLGENEISEIAVHYTKSAEDFLRAISLPDETLPLIGDTSGKDKGLSYIQKSDVDVIDYTKSGYAIIRGNVFSRQFHLIFKNCHMSQYHRHDDDLSIHLYFDGHTLLGDGGLGSYNEADPQRILIRSAFAHNAPYIVGHQPIRATAGLNGWHPATRIRNQKIIGVSYCHGVAIRRQLDFSQLSKGRLVITDTAPGGMTPTLATNFFSILGLDRQDSTLLTRASTDYSLRITSAGSSQFRSHESAFHVTSASSKRLRLSVFIVRTERHEI